MGQVAVLFDKLRALAKEVTARVPNVNSGGCAVFATLVGRRLLALGIEVEVIACDNIHYAVRGRLRNGKFFTFDANKLRKSETEFGVFVDLEADTVEPYVAGPWGTGLSVEAVERLAANESIWNPVFKREQIPTIESLVAQHLG